MNVFSYWRPVILSCALATALATLLGVCSCDMSRPIKIGFVGNLTGRGSDLGVGGRNGVILAVETLNRTGGINERRVELLIRDDQHDPDVARTVDQDLIDQDVVAIIGHMTSTMSLAAVDLVNKEHVVMISPTTATSELSGLDDYFIRVMSENRPAVARLANYMVQEKGFRRIAVAFDADNRAFSEEWFSILKATVAENEDIEVFPYPSTLDNMEEISNLAEDVLRKKVQAVVVVGAALDVALFCQQLRKRGAEIPVFSPMWAMTDDFLRHGGRTVEGVTFVHWFHKEYVSPVSQEFRNGFVERFHTQPNFAAHFSYEAAQVLFAALRKNADPSQLKSTIISQGTFPGIQGDLTIDHFGDAERRVFLLTVREGRFVTVE